MTHSINDITSNTGHPPIDNNKRTGFGRNPKTEKANILQKIHIIFLDDVRLDFNQEHYSYVSRELTAAQRAIPLNFE